MCTYVYILGIRQNNFGNNDWAKGLSIIPEF